MENSNRPTSAAVDDILEELKSKGGPVQTGASPNVDAILAEMGLGAKRPSPFDNVRPGAPVPPPVATKVQALTTQPAAELPPSAAEAVSPPDRQEAAGQAPPREAVYEYGEEASVQPRAEDVPLNMLPEEPREEPFVEEKRPPKRGKSATGTLIWDIEPEHTGMGPRVGKAAALDKVDPDKFVGDSELSRWFGNGGGMATSRKEQKKAEKEMRQRLVQEQRQSRRAAKRQAPEEYPEESFSESIPRVEIEQEHEAVFAYAPADEIAPTHETEPAESGEALPGGFEPPVAFAFREKPRRKGFLGRLFGKDDEEDDLDGIALTTEDAEGYAEDDWDKEDWAEDAGPYEDAFEEAFGSGKPAARPARENTASFAAVKARPEAEPVLQGNIPAEKMTTASFATVKPRPTREDDGIEANTASFAAAYKSPPPVENPPESPLLANTAGFAAAMRPGGDAQPEDAYLDAFAAALGKAGPSRAPESVLAPEEASTAEWIPAQKPSATQADEDADPNTAEFAAALGKGPVLRQPKTAIPPKNSAGAGEDAPTAVFGAVAVEALAPDVSGTEGDTHSFEFGGQEGPERVPTAAFTQEFDRPAGASGDAVPDDRSLFLDDMVDDRFRQFFSETVVMDRATEEQSEKARRRRKRTRSAILTGEFARMAELVEQADMAEETGAEVPEEESFDDYDRPQDAPAVEGDIAALRTALSRRTVGSAIIAVLLLWMGLSFAEVLPLPEALSFAAAPYVFTGVYLALLLLVAAINFTTVATGLAGLFAAPTVDSAPALATLGALVQGAVLLVQLINKQPAEATLFGTLAALALCCNALGKRVRAVSILRNFKLASAGMDHSAAYTLDSTSELSYNITKGLEEEDPTLLVSRPTALVKGFLRQSFSQRATDRTGRTIGWISLAAGLAATALCLILGLINKQSVNVFGAVSAFVAVLCIAAPFSSSLVSGVPSLLLQRATARLGAVVPGWSAIEELGRVNVVMATARDIFPPHVVSLKGIKTFEKERIDVAILYAASVLIEGCDTLKDIFSGVIQGKNDMLYKVESLVREPGRGFTAWVQNNRVVIGSREMLQKHDVTPPPVELEVKHVPDGHMPVYLAVSGKLFAMFIVGYKADPEVKATLNGLVKSGVSLLITSDDMNVTNELIEHAYRLPHGVVKVLGRRELDILEPLTSYTPDSEGVMTHIGSFASFIGGMRSAAGCAAAERMSSIVQLASVILAGALCLLLAFGGGLATLSLALALLYQAAWTLLVAIMPFMRRY